jgi:hypothetical protein
MGPGPLRHKSRRREGSLGPCLYLALAGVFVLVLCYVAFVVVHNISPTAIEQDAQRRATATSQSAIQLDAGATVVAEIKAAATQTALAGLTTPTPLDGNGARSTPNK